MGFCLSPKKNGLVRKLRPLLCRNCRWGALFSLRRKSAGTDPGRWEHRLDNGGNRRCGGNPSVTLRVTAPLTQGSLCASRGVARNGTFLCCFGLRLVGAGVPDGPCGTWEEAGGTLPHPSRIGGGRPQGSPLHSSRKRGTDTRRFYGTYTIQ